MYAVDDLSDAIDVTRNFLTPVKVWLWFKLALVILFIGGGGFGNPAGFGGDPEMFADEPTTDTGLESAPPTDELLVGLIIIGAIVFVLWLLWSALAALMEFVFVESLSAEEVRVRRYVGRNVGRAIHLLFFRIALGLGALVLVGVPVGLTIAAIGFEGVTAGIALLFVFVALFVGLLYTVASRFTTVFVTAVMLHEDRGVISAWRRFWPTLTANWKEYVVYLVLIWIIQIAVGIAVAFLGIIGTILLGLVFGVPVFALATLAGDIGLILAVLIGIVGVVVIILLWLLIDVPVQSYYRYYGLLLLGDTEAELDLVADQRARVRGDGGDADDGDHWDRDGDDEVRDRDERADGWESSSSWDDDAASSWDDEWVTRDDEEDASSNDWGRDGDDRDEDDRR